MTDRQRKRAHDLSVKSLCFAASERSTSKHAAKSNNIETFNSETVHVLTEKQKQYEDIISWIQPGHKHVCVCMCSVLLCPEEICTLVIAEAFPEDGGLFCCTASNPYGSVNCTAHLTVTAGWYDKGSRKNDITASPRSGVGKLCDC